MNGITRLTNGLAGQLMVGGADAPKVLPIIKNEPRMIPKSPNITKTIVKSKPFSTPGLGDVTDVLLRHQVDLPHPHDENMPGVSPSDIHYFEEKPWFQMQTVPKRTCGMFSSRV